MNCLTYSPCPEGCRGFDIPKGIVTGPFNNAEQNRGLKYFYWIFLNNGCGEGGAGCPYVNFDS